MCVCVTLFLIRKKIYYCLREDFFINFQSQTTHHFLQVILAYKLHFKIFILIYVVRFTVSSSSSCNKKPTVNFNYNPHNFPYTLLIFENTKKSIKERRRRNACLSVINLYSHTHKHTLLLQFPLSLGTKIKFLLCYLCLEVCLLFNKKRTIIYILQRGEITFEQLLHVYYSELEEI